MDGSASPSRRTAGPVGTGRRAGAADVRRAGGASVRMALPGRSVFAPRTRPDQPDERVGVHRTAPAMAAGRSLPRPPAQLRRGAARMGAAGARATFGDTHSTL